MQRAPSQVQALAWTAFAAFNEGPFLIYGGQESETTHTPSLFDIDKVVLQIAERLRDAATEQDRIPFQSGDLEKSIQVSHLGKGKASVGSNLVYARAVHDGHPAITIKPNISKNPPRGERTHRNKKRARLKFSIGGKTIYAKSVKLPAMEGQPFLAEAAEEIEKEGFNFLLPFLRKTLSRRLSEQIVKDIKINIVL